MENRRGLAGVISIMFMFGMWLLGCQAAIPSAHQPTKNEKCEKLGTVEQESVEQTSHGYPYNYFIYLPPCYDPKGEKTYPVLYLLPGRGSGPGSWFAAGANEIADELILSGTVPAFIIVGTEDISSDPMAEIIFNDLLPHIENNYRLKPGRQYRSTSGGSLGSVGAYRLAFQYPDHFASAGIFGGGLISGEEPRVEGWLNEMAKEEEPRVFLNTGEQDPLMMDRAEVMIDLLDEKQIEHAEVFTAGGHTYGYWASNFPTYFEWLAEDWK